jgi:hypothetical protein
LAPGAVGVSAGQIGEHPGGFREPDVSAAAGDGVPKCLCDMGFADSSASTSLVCSWSEPGAATSRRTHR